MKKLFSLQKLFGCDFFCVKYLNQFWRLNTETECSISRNRHLEILEIAKNLILAFIEINPSQSFDECIFNALSRFSGEFRSILDSFVIHGFEIIHLVTNVTVF